MALPTSKPERSVFVIMPFVSTPTRNQDQLTSFFENNIRRPIESADLAFQYQVRRSGESFNITEEIIKELYHADIVIADLSGILPNPNVMYELGVRLALSTEPVILIRERNSDNKSVFDVSTYYTLSYDPLNYPSLETSLVDKLRRLESGEDRYESPIYRTLKAELAVTRAANRLDPAQQRGLIVDGARTVADSTAGAFGPDGAGVAFKGEYTDARILYSGVTIANSMSAANPLQNEGVGVMTRVAEDIQEKVGDGTKTGILIAAKLMEAGASALIRGNSVRGVVNGVTDACSAAIAALESACSNDMSEAQLRHVARSAARDPTVAALAEEVFGSARPDDLIAVEQSASSADRVLTVAGMRLFRGLASEELARGEQQDPVILENSFVLLYPHGISSMAALRPILEQVARLKRPLLILADQIEGDALATLIVNNSRGRLRCMAVRGLGERQLATLDDIAAYTGGTVLSQTRGYQLESAMVSDLGRAARAEVFRDQTLISGGGGDPIGIAARADELRREIAVQRDSAHRDRLQSRLAGLVGKAITVQIGGSSENDVRDRSYRFTTALHAMGSAARGGVVPGGGTAFLDIRAAVRSRLRDDEAFNAGVHALMVALEEPIRRLAVSAGLQPEDVILGLSRPGEGLNVTTRHIEPMLEGGIVDPVGMVQGALASAVAQVRDFLQTASWNLGPAQTQSGPFAQT